MIRHLFFWGLLLGVLVEFPSDAQSLATDPQLPNKKQLEWQKMSFYAFIHFNMNTFSGKEWGLGDEDPTLFNPTDLDTDQWAKTIKEAGMKGVILTAKHHDGFCLWPSKFTEHSVKNSPWKLGNGDVVKSLADSCKKYGLKLGVYLSPWDRHEASYGTEAYLTYYRNQLTELLTQYGPIFEIWLDGANGGDGYYGGANETRMVDKKNYYDWPETMKLMRKLQPNAVIFSDAGPDVRWVGNEKGYANQTTWSTIFRDSLYAGMPDFDKYASGQMEGTHWVPTETDVSIRPGWFYHKEEDSQVKSVEKLWDIYCNSVGLNSNLLLNIPVDTKGLIHPTDAKHLKALGDKIKNVFSRNLLEQSVLSELDLWDNRLDTYREAVKPIEIEFNKELRANVFVVQENIMLGQHIAAFEFEVQSKGKWVKVYSGTTVGNRRIIRFEEQPISAIRFKVSAYKNTPLISEMGLFYDAQATQATF